MNYFVTGASSGIGAELARQLAARGDRLALLARREDRLAEVADQCERAAREGGAPTPARPLLYSVDMLDYEGLARALSDAWANLPGGIDVLVLNAGIGGDANVERFSAATAAKILGVNLTANLYAIEAVLPGMLARRAGHIVGVSSVAGYRGLPGGAPYSASKAGFSVLLEGLRIDLKPRGVAVTVVSPGFVRSEMTAKNRFPMPFLLDTDQAVRRLIRGMDRRQREVAFPWPLVLGMRLLRALPDPLYDWIGERLRRKRERSGGKGGFEAGAAAGGAGALAGGPAPAPASAPKMPPAPGPASGPPSSPAPQPPPEAAAGAASHGASA